MKMKKQELRKELRNISQKVRNNEDYRNKESERICRDILKSSLFSEASTVLAYMAMDDEVCIGKVISECFAQEKKVALPRILNKDGLMKFFCLSDSGSTITGYWNIAEPDESAPELETENLQGKILVLVPGMAFSKEGERLGRGKGFYDRELILLRKSIKDRITFAGVCFPFAVRNDIPSEDHDVKVDFLFC